MPSVSMASTWEAASYERACAEACCSLQRCVTASRYGSYS